MRAYRADVTIRAFRESGLPQNVRGSRNESVVRLLVDKLENPGCAGVTIQIDSDGDGVFERTITADNELTADEFGEVPPHPFPAQVPSMTPIGTAILIGSLSLLAVGRIRRMFN
jgi:hypothetical protein